MLTNQEIERLSEGYKDMEMDLGSERAKVRRAYTTEESIEQLTRLLVNCKVFSRVANEGEVALHNLGIAMLEDMGILDEENIKLLVKTMLELPLLNGK